jgi:hypothetical protein
LLTWGLNENLLYVSRFLPIDHNSVRLLGLDEVAIAFAENEVGEEYVLRKRENEYAVWILHSENEAYLICNNFEEFVERLGRDPIE